MLGSAGRLLAALVALVGLLWPAFIPDTGDASGVDDPATITDYTASLVVDREGTLRATERITTEMPIGRHGIFRFWDVADQGDPNARLVPKDIEVTQDGGDANVELLLGEEPPLPGRQDRAGRRRAEPGQARLRDQLPRRRRARGEGRRRRRARLGRRRPRLADADPAQRGPDRAAGRPAGATARRAPARSAAPTGRAAGWWSAPGRSSRGTA